MPWERIMLSVVKGWQDQNCPGEWQRMRTEGQQRPTLRIPPGYTKDCGFYSKYDEKPLEGWKDKNDIILFPFKKDYLGSVKRIKIRGIGKNWNKQKLPKMTQEEIEIWADL